MHHGVNPDYQRASVPPPRYGTAAAPEACPPFPGPFNRLGFPPHFPNPVSYPISIPPPGFQGFSTDSSYQAAAPTAQFPARWTRERDELQDLEVKKKAEKFLRMLDNDDWMTQSGESGHRGTRRTSAEGELERHAADKRSKGRSRSKSRSRSGGRSRGRSRARSRGRSRAQSRTRSGSRGKSRTRAKSRPRSRSRSRGRSLARGKSQSRAGQDSQRSGMDTALASVSARVPDLFQNLKQVLQSKELEKHLSMIKNPFMSHQVQEDTRLKPQTAQKPPQDSQSAPSAVLPHERLSGSDSTSRILSWNDPGRDPEAFPNKCVFSSIEDEEEFLYGDDDGRKKPQAVTVPLAQTRPAQNPPPVPQEPNVQAATARRVLAPDVSAEECERVKNMLKTIGLNLSPADISKMATRLKQKQEEQRGAGTSTAQRTTVETLPNRSKVQKSDDARSNRSESSHSHRESADRARSEEKERREKQIQKKRKEYLVKELEDLLKHEGSADLIPVIGFFCPRCEEFFGDLGSAEGHKHTDTHQNISHGSSVAQDEQLKDDEGSSERRQQDERGHERKRPRADSRSPYETEGRASSVQEDDAQSTRSGKKRKKKKKEKKKKKKDKKNKKKEQGESAEK